MRLIALPSGDAHRWAPKPLRLRLFTIAAALTRRSRKTMRTPNQEQPWATVAHDSVTALRALHAPADPGAPNTGDRKNNPGLWTRRPPMTASGKQLNCAKITAVNDPTPGRRSLGQAVTDSG